jgi:hypothetical protein
MILAILSVAACVNPSERIATSLASYGLSGDQSQCVGNELERNLSVGQLRQLGRAAGAFAQGGGAPGGLTAADLVRVSSQIDDLKVPLEVGKAAARCGLLSGARL